MTFVRPGRAAPLVALVVALAAGLARGRDEIPVPLGSGSTLSLAGTSNVHDFESRTSEVRVAIEIDASKGSAANPAALLALIRAGGVREVDVTVPVTTLHSGKSGLDKNMYKALRADRHPDITFEMEHYAVTPAHGDTLAVRAEGHLEVAGHRNDEVLEARLWRSPQGVWLEGRHPLRMTAFDVKPPRMMMGALRTDDRVTVRYKLLLTSGATPTHK